MAFRNVLLLLIVAVLFASTSTFSRANAVDTVPHDGSSGVQLEHVEPGVANTFTHRSFAAAQEERRRIADFTSGAFSEKPRNTPAAPPAITPAPGVFGMKPRSTPAPPAVGPAIGTKTNWNVKSDQLAKITVNNELDRQVSLQCHSGQNKILATILQAWSFFTFSVDESVIANIPVICDFSVIGVSAIQSFPVWAHDGTPYLSDCDDCLWKVQNNGFWLWSPTQGTFVNLHSWNL